MQLPQTVIASLQIPTGQEENVILPAAPYFQYLSHKTAIDAAITNVLNQGIYIHGQSENEFSKNFAQYLGVKHMIGVASGTDALKVALLAGGIKSGDEVIIPVNTSQGSMAGIYEIGAVPVYADILETTYNLDPQAVLKLVTAKTKAIIAVHLYGHPADLTALKAIADQSGLLLIEDCAQAHGAQFDGKKVGTFGDLAIFSFYPTKNLGAIGDGGAVVTNNDHYAEQAKLFREYGWKTRYISEKLGFVSRLDEIQAAILNCKLPALDQENEQRRKIADHYTKQLKDLVGTPLQLDNCYHVYHQYVIRTAKREQLMQFLKKNYVFTNVIYPQTLNLQPALKHFQKVGQTFPVAEKVAGEILSLPIYPELTTDQIRRVANLIKQFFNEK
ncbi:MAG: DegT/DnrJ/EryC1/StrS family aminotransferase [bacterium]